MDKEDALLKKGDHKHFEKEKKGVEHFEKLARVVADKAGLVGKDIPWKEVT